MSYYGMIVYLSVNNERVQDGKDKLYDFFSKSR